jgi:mRNA interferase MazF
VKTVYVRTKTKDEARKRAEWLYMILRDCTPVIADLHTSKAQVVTESMVIKYVPENYTMDGIRCDIAIGFGQLGKIIATENTCDNLMDERELAKYIVDNETISENENIECRRQKSMNGIKRGEMFYISRGGASYNGSEQHADRPAVVVSNNKNNENSNVVEVVYMTTQQKTDLPTHVTIRSTGRISTVLCEQVYSVSTERVGTYIGECTDKEMENIDIALMISLQLDGNMKTSKKYNETIKEQQEEIDSLKKEIEMLQQEHEDAIAEIEQDAAVYVEENKKIANTEKTEDTIRLQTERDTYKTMYEQLLNRLVNGGAA